MSRALDAIARLCVALWTGAVAAVAFAVAPRVFGFLGDPPRAGELLRPIFRAVDLFGVGAAALFALAARGSRWRAGAALVAGAAAAAYAFVLAPRIGEGPGNLHALSEALWGVILVLGAALVVAGPRAPR